jgi:tRNA threonylcarbamoyladenosine biosynthesis protein TsaE
VRFLTEKAEQTIAIGRRLGRKLRAGHTVCLIGDLGAGKTTFTKGLAEASGIDRNDIASASFTIVAEYDTAPPFYHIDLYRLRGEADMDTAGVFDYIGGDGIAVIEWAEKARLNGDDVISVHINLVSENEREIIIEGADDEDWDNL